MMQQDGDRGVVAEVPLYDAHRQKCAREHTAGVGWVDHCRAAERLASCWLPAARSRD